MKIGIDIRMIHNSGIGHYIRGLIANAGNGSYIPFGGSAIPIKSPVFSIREQVEVPIRQAGHQLDLWHSPQFNIPILSRLPVVVTIHDIAFDFYPEEFPSWPAKAYYKVMFPLALRKARAIITPSHATRQNLLDFYGSPEDKVFVVPHGIDFARFAKKPEPQEADAFLALHGIKKPFILYVGLRRPRKNLATLLHALRHVKGEIQLVVVGPKDKRFIDLSGLAKSIGVENRVVETGSVDSLEDLITLYHEASVFALPSLCEGFGFPVLEAMVCQTPVVTSNMSALPEVAGDAAVLVDPKSPSDIAGAINKLLDNASFRTELAQMAFARAKEFTWAKALEKTMKVYEGVL